MLGAEYCMHYYPTGPAEDRTLPEQGPLMMPDQRHTFFWRIQFSRMPLFLNLLAEQIKPKTLTYMSLLFMFDC